MTNKIRIVTDSTSDLPLQYAAKNEVCIIPLYVNFPDATYRDGVDLLPSQFYPMLEKSQDQLPKTSTPTRDDFVNTYRNLLEHGYDVISIHISSGLSGTVAVAESAAREFKDKIRIFDSKSISLGIGLQVKEAVEMVKQNFSADKVISRLYDIRERTEVLFSLDTLKYLEKGGRIGKVSALLGNILNIKPVIRVENGIYIPLDKVRNQQQAARKMVEYMKKTLGDNLPINIAVAHGAASEAAHNLKNMVEEAVDKKIDYLQEVGPVIGVHTGPGTQGLAFIY